MGTLELKSNLHALIDGIENPQLLESLHEMLSNRLSKGQFIWSKLAEEEEEEEEEEEKSEVLKAYMESENLDNLIPNSEIMKSLK